MAASGASRVLGQLLIARGVVGEVEVAAALAEQRVSHERVGEVLVRRGVDPESVAEVLAAQLRLPYGAPPLAPEPAALALVDRELAMRHRVVPLAVVERGVRIALADPLDLAVMDDLRFQTGRRVEPVVATRRTIDAALTAAYGAGHGLRNGLGSGPRNGLESSPGSRSGGDSANLPGSEPWPASEYGAGVGAGPGSGSLPGAGSDPAELNALRRASEAPPIVALVDLILQRAVAVRASDIHIEPAEGRLRVRARVDGVLREILELPEQTVAGIASRLKILAGMDISVKRRPQDGRSAVWVGGRELALRVSTLPAQGGEKVVLRLLDPENAGRRLEELGMDAVTFERFNALLGRGHGVLLVTGPTGSGKTTTLYGALAALDRDSRNIMTLEDPVEYRLPGLTQVQVHRRAGLSFAAALRAALRQDPDVIMVGELRDQETVETAMAAALTGHLVLSTLHTNDAPGAVTRLIEMGAPHYLIASGLIGVLAQRLVRRICPHCREARAPDPMELEGVPPSLRPATLYEPRGCARCEGSGYRGRVGIYELLTVDSRIRELIMRRASTDAIRDAARAAGLRTLGQSAWDQVREGVTTVAEVRPFVALSAEEAPVCPTCGTGLRSDFAACPGCGRMLRERCGCGRWFEEGWRCCPGCGVARVGG